ncbi:hypothetical protein L6164_029847 [Bauhinia variegata]|uniref:Uncharacterized protein n=1 Tax=Bauhinia variegata TaxID=167791 RepID=A0ACB9LBU7_BAUVA|nr:hypothetical protein L6164_029847 [Bauhinia variegata]
MPQCLNYFKFIKALACTFFSSRKWACTIFTDIVSINEGKATMLILFFYFFFLFFDVINRYRYDTHENGFCSEKCVLESSVYGTTKRLEKVIFWYASTRVLHIGHFDLWNSRLF